MVIVIRNRFITPYKMAIVSFTKALDMSDSFIAFLFFVSVPVIVFYFVCAVVRLLYERVTVYTAFFYVFASPIARCPLMACARARTSFPSTRRP